MMSMSMQLVPRQIQRLESPCAESVFPAVDQLLEDTEYQKALKYVAGRKDMDRYNSMVDFLFAELMGGIWKAACLRYYEGKGCKLIDDPRATPEMLAEWEKQIVMALDVAHDDMNEERTRSWVDFHRRWQKRIA